MKKIYSVEVNDESETKKYVVTVNNLSGASCKFLAEKNFIRFLILLICGLMFTVFFLNRDNSQNTEKYIKSYNAPEECCNPIKKEITKKVYKDPLPYICVSVFSIIGIVCFTMILIKDDTDIRHAKLDALREIKDAEGFVFVPANLNDILLDEVREVKALKRVDSGNETYSKTEVYKNLRAELAKKYMDAIVEI